MCVSSAFEPWHQGPTMSRKSSLLSHNFHSAGGKLCPASYLCQATILIQQSLLIFTGYISVDFGDSATLNTMTHAWTNISYPFSLCHSALAHQNHQQRAHDCERIVVEQASVRTLAYSVTVEIRQALHCLTSAWKWYIQSSVFECLWITVKILC